MTLVTRRKNNTVRKIQQHDAELGCTGIRNRRLQRADACLILAYNAHDDLDAANDPDEDLDDRARVIATRQAFNDFCLFTMVGWRQYHAAKTEQAAHRTEIIAQVGEERYHKLDQTLSRLRYHYARLRRRVLLYRRLGPRCVRYIDPL